MTVLSEFMDAVIALKKENTELTAYFAPAKTNWFQNGIPTGTAPLPQFVLDTYFSTAPNRKGELNEDLTLICSLWVPMDLESTKKADAMAKIMAENLHQILTPGRVDIRFTGRDQVHELEKGQTRIRMTFSATQA